MTNKIKNLPPLILEEQIASIYPKTIIAGASNAISIKNVYPIAEVLKDVLVKVAKAYYINKSVNR